jgi:hypothetical protein
VTSRGTSKAAKFRAAELDEGLAAKPSPEEKNSRCVFTVKERKRSSELASSRLGIRRTLCQQSEVKMRHSEGRIQVGGGLVVLHSAGLVAGMLPTERHQVMRAGIQFIEI